MRGKRGILMGIWSRKILAGVLGACMVLGATACGGLSKKPAVIRIGVTVYREDDTFVDTILNNLQQLVKQKEQENGININLSIEYGRDNQTTQNEQVDYFLTQQYDIVCVNIVDRTAAAVIIDKAQAADIPVIFFNREPVKEDLLRWDEAYYVGAPAEDSGTMQGEIVLNVWRQDPSLIDKDGDGVIQYVVLEGEPGHQDALLRTENSVKVLTQAGVPVEKLDSTSALWQRGVAKTKMIEWLEQADKQIELVLANNDDMALGAIDAYEEKDLIRNQKPFIVGVDATPPALEAMGEGLLDGTVYNDGAGQAKTMIDLAYAVANGEDVSEKMNLENGQYIWLSYAMITKDNLDEFPHK